MPRITVATVEQLATYPPMLKAGEASSGADHDVRVVNGRFGNWASTADEALHHTGTSATRRWHWERCALVAAVQRVLA
jgi:hypothetical protein